MGGSAVKHAMIAACLLVATAAPALAQDPTLVGTWKGTVAGIGADGDAQSGDVTWVITQQTGRTFRGHVTYPDKGGAGARSEFVGAIAADDRTIMTADDDGFTSGHFLDLNTIDHCYVEMGIDKKVACARIVRQR
jgi:hypothetical protein